jgi:hypothetical protein
MATYLNGLSFSLPELCAWLFPGYYRKRGKLRTALNYCRQALGIEAKMQENVRVSDGDD